MPGKRDRDKFADSEADCGFLPSFPHNQPAAQDARRRHKADPFSASPPVLLRCSVAPAAAPALFRVRKVRQQPTNHHRNFSGYLFPPVGIFILLADAPVKLENYASPGNAAGTFGENHRRVVRGHNHRPQNGGVLVLVFPGRSHGIPAGYRFYPGTLS